MSGAVHAFLSDDHRQCDDIFASLEGLVSKSKWDQASLKFQEFNQRIEEHFNIEENTLFSLFEAKTGMTGGPTAVMRSEHIQIRELISKMGDDITARDQDNFLGNSETLMILLQQHNMKEEQMLYNMMDNAFGVEAASIINQLKKTHSL